MLYEDSILVDELPICESSNLDTIYALSTDYHYYQCSFDTEYYYEDLGIIPQTFHYSDKDFYLFYDFATISEFDIFESYDFTSFTDYQKLSVVIGFNILFVIILAFFVSIIYKVVARFFRFILG